MYVLPLDVRFNEASRNKVFCRRDANDPNQQEQVQPCETATTRVTLTLTAATAKAAGLAKREISSVVVPLNANDNFKHDLSRSEVRKLKKLKVVKLVVSMSVTYNGTTREAPPRKMTGGRGANGQALIIGLGERETEQGDAGRGR